VPRELVQTYPGDGMKEWRIKPMPRDGNGPELLAPLKAVEAMPGLFPNTHSLPVEARTLTGLRYGRSALYRCRRTSEVAITLGVLTIKCG
jgi:hypothetical protein